MAIKTIDEYLYRIQEIYSPSIVLTSIHGDFQSDWTDCFNSKCSKETNKYDLSYCKTNCIITAATTAISRIAAETTKCSSARVPKKCVNSLKNAIATYQKKIKHAREMQTKITNKQAEFKRQAT